MTRARTSDPAPAMSNVLEHTTQQQILALGRLGWTLSRIQQTTGVRRETISGYLKAAGIPVRGRGRPNESKPKPAISGGEVSTDLSPPKPAISEEVSTDCFPTHPATRGEVSTDSGTIVRPGRAPSASACEPYRELIVEALGRGRNAMAIWQDLVDGHGFPARYASVRRFVVGLRGASPKLTTAVFVSPCRNATRPSSPRALFAHAGSFSFCARASASVQDRCESDGSRSSSVSPLITSTRSRRRSSDWTRGWSR